MTIRKLASIQQILALDPIPDADRIEVATIQGWKVVVNKGIHQVGELVCYFEIDAFIKTELAPFLTKPDHFPKEYEGVKGERLKTAKFKGMVSQGLVLPLTAIGVIHEKEGVLFLELPDPPVDCQTTETTDVDLQDHEPT